MRFSTSLKLGLSARLLRISNVQNTNGRVNSKSLLKEPQR